MKDRETQVMQARGRLLLDILANNLVLYGGDESQFRASHANRWPSNAARQNRAVMCQFLGEKDGNAAADVQEATMATAYRVLAAIATAEKITPATVSEAELDGLTQMLDSDAGPIRFSRTDPMSGAACLPYRRTGLLGPQSMAAYMATLLLEYMNICALYGRMHQVCQRKGCGALMAGGRGGKKFCSSACRQAHWSYSEQREYYSVKKKGARKHKATVRATKGGKRATLQTR